MLRKIGTVAQVKKIKEQLHPDLYQAITHDLYLMDSIYGSGRSYFTHGGYSVIVDSKDDLPELQNIIDLKSHAPEELQFYSSCNYLSALFLMNNDFSIMVWIPASLVKSFLDKL